MVLVFIKTPCASRCVATRRQACGSLSVKLLPSPVPQRLSGKASSRLAVLCPLLGSAAIAANFHFFFTVTVNPQLAELFTESFAVQLTGVVPSGKLDPDGGVQVIVTGLQLSVAVTV